MKYFDLVPVGQLVTRSVSDIESIARIFSQGLFMIISDLMKMVVVCVLHELAADLDCGRCNARFSIHYPDISTQDASAFEDVRNQISNMNSFVQERVTGMKILQLFNRRKLNRKFKEINDKHKKAWIKTILITPFSFQLPILSPR
jgi:ABC-type multidrug transport system fused ATPase/permease subunit